MDSETFSAEGFEEGLEARVWKFVSLNQKRVRQTL
jgi:hypothetical protein